MKRLESICKELDNKLNKRYGNFGRIICTIENNHVKVVIEENYLYIHPLLHHKYIHINSNFPL